MSKELDLTERSRRLVENLPTTDSEFDRGVEAGRENMILRKELEREEAVSSTYRGYIKAYEQQNTILREALERIAYDSERIYSRDIAVQALQRAGGGE